MKAALLPGDAFLLMRLCRHIEPRRRPQFAAIAALMLLSAASEVVSLGVVLPFVRMLTNPADAARQPAVAWVFQESAQPGGIELPLTLAFVGAVTAAGAIRLLLLWTVTRYTLAVGADLSLQVYRRTLYQPYWVHVERNTSEAISSIRMKIEAVVFGVLLALLSMVSAVILLLAIVAALFAIDPGVAAASAVCFAAGYVVVARTVRARLRANSRMIADAQGKALKALQEGLGGIRDVLLDGTQEVFCDIYRRADVPLRWAQGNSSFLAQSPRFVLEAFGMALIALLAFWLSRDGRGLGASLPVLAALAVGAQRLIPAMQQAYNSWATVVGNQGSLSDIVDILDEPVPPESARPATEPLAFSRGISFEGVRFRYSHSGPWVLDGLTLTIPKGARAGFVGATGSGKSTALDILMGLLRPTEGRILVDGKPLDAGNLRAWQRAIAHVPQSIYLADMTIAENIAFGVPRERIDSARVREAAQQAMIAEFVESLPDRYDSRIGERGVRLSGGQRQRIGIARALYKQAALLVLDEATSALDNATERAVIESIQALRSDLTVIVIAHRLNTTKRCDVIYELDNGRVAASGTYEQLLAASPTFRGFVAAEDE